VAISAAFAFGSTSVLAQDVAVPPSIELPPAVDAAPATPATAEGAAVETVPQQKPTIVLPAAITQAAQEPQEPKAEPAAPPSQEASRRAEAPRKARAAVPAKAAPRPADDAAPADTAPVTDPVTDDVPVVGADMAAAPVAIPEAAQPAAPVAEAPRDSGVPHAIKIPDEAIAAAVLGFLGLGLAGFLATRRRREDEDETVEMMEGEPVDDTPVTSIPSELEVHAAEPAPMPVSASSPAFPDGEVPTGEARQRLLNEMVAAPPDSVNPFTSRGARRKRARIILQAREHRLRQQQDQRQQAGEPFDWRSFKATAVSDPADSPMVDA
jgi:LPXTG-motif cell wall-anchored protein